MTKNDWVRFWAVMKALEEWSGQPSTKEKAELYFKSLFDMSIEDIEKAAWDIIGHRTTASFPKPGEIREAITGKVDEQATLALNKIEAAIPKYGNGHADTVVFDDPIIHATIQALGGWITVSEIYWTDEWGYYTKRISDTYKALKKNPPAMSNIPLQLEGWHDRNNRLHGLDYKTNVFQIGDTKLIKAWQGSAARIESGAGQKVLENLSLSVAREMK